MIDKQKLYDSLKRRVTEYSKVIPAYGDGNMRMHMQKVGSVLLMGLKNTEIKYDIFGKDQWGYGINFIHEGEVRHENLDVTLIAKVNELNKHQKYNLFWLLVFKVEKGKFVYSVFCMDVCSGKFNFDTNKTINLERLQHVSFRKRDSFTYIDLILSEQEKPFSFQIDTAQGDENVSEYKAIFDKVLEENIKVKNNLNALGDSGFNLNVDLEDLIKEGENKHIEFKSSLRYDMKQQGVPAKVIEHGVLKTIAAFINSTGGILFIGVDDNGSSLGLDPDFNSFKGINKKDEFQKHFDNLLQNALSNAIIPLVEFSFFDYDGKTIGIVKVKKGASEVFLKDGNDSKFYIRRNSSTTELKAEEIIKYVKLHWK